MGDKISVEKKLCISLMIDWSMVSQFEWKKLAEKPSGSGALSAWIANIASFISVGVRSL